MRDEGGSISVLIRSFDAFDLKDKTVAVQLYGQPADELINWLNGK